jgi:hypothetical protein
MFRISFFRLSFGFLVFAKPTLDASERFFNFIGVLEPPKPNQIFCDYLNACAAPSGQDLFVVHRADFKRFGKDENLLFASFNRSNGSLAAAGPVLHLRPPSSTGASTTEDPRLCWHDGQILGLYTSTESGERMDPRFFCLAEFTFGPDGRDPTARAIHRLRFDGAHAIEKNWVGLSDPAGFFIVYSLFPCRVLKVDLQHQQDGMLNLEEAFRSGLEWSPNGKTFFSNSTNFVPILLDGTRHYLGMYHFFHETYPNLFRSPSDGRPLFRSYFTGFIILRGEPPFDVCFCPPPILDELFDLGGRHRVVFPTGLWIEGDEARCTVGINDRETWLMSVPLERVIKRCQDWPLLEGLPQWRWKSVWPGLY